MLIGTGCVVHVTYTGDACASTSDSARPVIFNTRRNRPPPSDFGASRSAITASSIGFISRGGPGSNTSAVESLSSHKPGAVPFGLGSTSAPRGTIAWRRLMSGIVMPRRAKRSRIRSTIDSSTSSAIPSARATASRVMSSSVGPRPPVTTIRSAQASALSTTRASSPMSSATTAFRRTS